MKCIDIYLNDISNSFDIHIDLILNTICINNKINNKIKQIEVEKVMELLRIIRRWKKHYNGKIIDSLRFKICIDGEEIVGNGGYPDNFDSFIDWINSVYE